ncbi:MAG: GNAT family N-acetyltransferase [Syntrophobacteraceae bacterium]
MSRCIETERLLLRRPHGPEIELLTGMLGTPGVMRWLFSGAPMEPDSARSFIEKEFTFGEESFGLGIICEKGTGQFVGFGGVIPCRHLGVDDFEFGFAFQENFRGKGYAKEIGNAQIKYGFENLPVDRLLALAHPQNIPSLKVIENMGMRFLKEIVTEQRGPRRVYVIERVCYESSV